MKKMLPAVLMMLAAPLMAGQFSEEQISEFHNAVAFGDKVITSAMLDEGFDVDAPRGKRASTPLITAAKFCQPEVAKLLLDSGADVLRTDSDSQSALAWAQQKGCDSVSDMLDVAVGKAQKSQNEGSVSGASN